MIDSPYDFMMKLIIANFDETAKVLKQDKKNEWLLWQDSINAEKIMRTRIAEEFPIAMRVLYFMDELVDAWARPGNRAFKQVLYKHGIVTDEDIMEVRDFLNKIEYSSSHSLVGKRYISARDVYVALHELEDVDEPNEEVNSYWIIDPELMKFMPGESVIWRMERQDHYYVYGRTTGSQPMEQDSEIVDGFRNYREGIRTDDDT